MSILPRKALARSGPATAPQETTSVPFFTIMLDVSANLLCVVVLLLTISAASQSRRLQTTEVGFPIVAGEIMAPAGLVESFRLRTVRSDGVSTIDLLRHHVEVKPAGATPFESIRLPLDVADFAATLRRSLPAEPGKVIVFVFSQEGHAGLRRTLDDVATTVSEIDVPLALRAKGPDGAWSPPFLGLFARELAPETFPERLAAIIAGGGGLSGAELSTSGRSSGTGGAWATIWTGLQAAWRLALLLLSLYAVVLVGRMRPLVA